MAPRHSASRGEAVSSRGPVRSRCLRFGLHRAEALRGGQESASPLFSRPLNSLQTKLGKGKGASASSTGGKRGWERFLPAVEPGWKQAEGVWSSLLEARWFSRPRGPAIEVCQEPCIEARRRSLHPRVKASPGQPPAWLLACMHPKISIGNTAAGARPPGGQPWCLPSTRSSVGNGGNGKKKGHQAAVPIRTAETEHPTHLPHGPFPSGSTGIPCVTPSILALRAVTPRGRSLLRAGRPGPAASSPSRVRHRLSQLGYFHRALYCPT